MASNFEEKSGIVSFKAPWGQWYQTVDEVVVEVEVEPGTRGKDVSVVAEPSNFSCSIKGRNIFKGKPFDIISEDESTWTVEDRKLVRIQLVKASRRCKDLCWYSLFDAEGAEACKPDPVTLNEMRKKLDLEQFQRENPGFDFSAAKLDKRYEEKSVRQMAKTSGQDI